MNNRIAIDSRMRTQLIDIGILLGFTLVFRLITLMTMNTGVDERDYWTAAKALRYALPYPELTHRTIRWTVILPAYFAQLIFGTGPNAYYVVPILFQMMQSALIYLIAVKLVRRPSDTISLGMTAGRIAGFMAAAALVVFPYSARVGSQLRPEVTSIVYILASFWFLLSYLDKQDQVSAHTKQTDKLRNFSSLWASLIFMYAAYHSKITNLYFLPGFLLIIWFIGRNFKHAMYYGLLLLALYVG